MSSRTSISHQDYLGTEASGSATAEHGPCKSEINWLQDESSRNLQTSSSAVPCADPEFPAIVYRQDQPPINVELTRYAVLARTVLRHIHLGLKGELLELLRQVTIERFVDREATAACLAVTGIELQAAADAFRLRNELSSSADFQSWLDRERLSLADFQDALHYDVLLHKLRNHLTSGRVAVHFDADRSRYDRALLSQIVLGRENFAVGMRDDIITGGSSFEELAKDFSLDRTSAVTGGDLGVVFRHQMDQAVAESIFQAVDSDLVGPLMVGHYYYLFLVKAIEPAKLDGLTKEIIRDELFNSWLTEQSEGGLRIDPELQALL